MIRYHLLQGVWCLIIRGVNFKGHKARQPGVTGGKRCCPIPVIGGDHPVAEFHAGLDHHGHYPLPGSVQSGIPKSPFVEFQR